MSDRERAPWWLGLLVALMGALVVSAAFWADDSSVHAPRWVVGAAGAAFLLAGLSILVPGKRRLSSLLLALMMTALAATFVWVSFLPGERQFSSTVSVPFLSVSGPGSDTLGRICFAPGAIGLSALALYLWVKLGRDWLGGGG